MPPFIIACALSCEVCMQWATTEMTGEEKDCTCAEKTSTKSLEILSLVGDGNDVVLVGNYPT